MKTISRTNSYAFAKRALSASALGFIAVLIASPAISGVSIPDSPLQSSSTIPPNIMFILDDSGSMAETFMAAPEATSDTEPTTNAPDIGQLTYARNGIYYDPATTYTAWNDYLGTGNYVADVTYAAAYSSPTLATVASGTINLGSSVRTYYVPKDLTNKTLTYLNAPTNYWRYQILTDGRVVRSEYVVYVAPPATALAVVGTNPSGAITNGNLTGSYTIVVPPGLSSLTIRSSGGTGTSADLYIRRGSAPDTVTYDFRDRTAGTNNETRTIANPTAGTYYVRLHANGSNFSGVTISADYIPLPSGADGCDTTTSGSGWRNCFQTTPTGRSEANERLNFARWYSFSRTRNKVAKSGAGEAFSTLSSDFRVGFTTIWNRST
ncbi:MAG: PPC domain-containing protein, partial [Arenimonas sp.]